MNESTPFSLQKSKLYRLRNIAVALDISKESDSALRFAWHIAEKAGARLEVVYVMDSIFLNHPSSDAGFLSGYRHTIQTELDAFIQETLLAMGVPYEPAVPGGPGTVTPQASPRISSKVLYGFSEATLEELSNTVDLLVIGTNGQGKKLFGSISVEVSQRAHCPVLLISPDAEFRGLKNILYACHFDSLSTLHVQQAVSFARHFDGQVHFVHVAEQGEKGIGVDGTLLEATYRESHPGHPFLFSKMISENVVEALYEYAFYHRIELIVFVTHAHTFWENMLHRSVTRTAAGSSDLPILVIHKDDC